MVKNKKKSKSKKQPDIALMTEIRVSIDKQSGEISIYNNGDGIDAEILKEHDMYPVQLIFGELLTSTNYDKTEQKIGGKNFGAKPQISFQHHLKLNQWMKKTKNRIRNNMSDEKIPYNGTL